MAKTKLAIKLAQKANFFGTEKAKKLIVSWGSPKGSILQALSMIKNKEDYAFLQIKTLWPVNPDLQKLISPFKEIIVIENNGTNQLVSLLKSQFDFNPTSIINKNDGRPFFVEEIIKLLEKK